MAVRYNQPRSAVTLQAILDAATRPMTVEEIAKISGRGVGTVKKYSKHLREEGRMHIGGWDGQTQLLLAGAGPDVAYEPKPKRKYERLTPEAKAYFERSVARRRVTVTAAKSSGMSRDPMVALLFGEYRGVAA